MRKDLLKKFRKRFEEQKKQFLFHDSVLREDFNTSNDDLIDDVDLATSDMAQSMRMRLRNREVLYLKKVNEALDRIDQGIFGLCESCDEPIEIKRLEARPTATLCIACKEEEEKKEDLTIQGRTSKSLGKEMKKFF